MTFRIGDMVTYRLDTAPMEIGVVIGIAEFQMMYRVHGLKVLWNDGGEEVEHPSDLRMIGRAVACTDTPIVVKSNYEE